MGAALCLHLSTIFLSQEDLLRLRQNLPFSNSRLLPEKLLCRRLVLVLGHNSGVNAALGLEKEDDYLRHQL